MIVFRCCLAIVIVSSSLLATPQVSLTVENDAFAGTLQDGHYSSGIQASLMLGRTEWSLGQLMFTPSDIEIDTAQPDDRPWAGFSYLQLSRLYPHSQTVDRLSVIVGVVGPDSGAESAQRSLHRAANMPTPRGWQHQLHNELTGSVLWQRFWPQTWSTTRGATLHHVGPYTGAALGTLWTYGSVGLVWRAHPSTQTALPLPRRPGQAPPSTWGTHTSPSHQQQRHHMWFGSIEVRALSHDLFLDGNTHQTSASIDKESLVYDLTGGIVVSTWGLTFSYSMIYRSASYHGQTTGDIFAMASLWL